MATQQEIEKTREALHKLRRYYTRPGSRVHDQTKVAWDAMEDALTHEVCSDCIFFLPKTTPCPSPTGQRVSLGCDVHLDPMRNWLDIFPGDPEPTCLQFSQIVKEEIAQ